MLFTVNVQTFFSELTFEIIQVDEQDYFESEHC